MFNRLIFPAPQPSYGVNTIPGELVHIPRRPSTAARVQRAADTAAPGTARPQAQTLAPSHADFTCGIFLRSAVADASHLVIYYHPNAVDIGHMRGEFVATTRRCPVSCLLVEYAGYGGILAAGSPSEENATDDGLAGYLFAQDVLGFAPKQIIVMGRSIGTGVACNFTSHLPAELAPLHVILQAPFTSIRNTVKTLVGKNLGSFAAELVGERFNNEKSIVHIKAPVTIIHGTKDEIVPYEHGVLLVAAAEKAGRSDVRLLSLNGVGHNDIPLQPGFDLINQIVADARKNAAAVLLPCPSKAIPFEQRLRPYCVMYSIFHELQRGRSRPPPLLKLRNNNSGGDAAVHKDFYLSLAHTLAYNMSSFISLVRTSWELYTLAREEAAAFASGSEQLFEYVSAVTSALSSLRGAHQLAEMWKLSDYVELCAALWGSPFSAGRLIKNTASATAATASSAVEAHGTAASRLLVFGTTAPDRAGAAFDGAQESSHYDELWTQRLSRTLITVYETVLEQIRKAQEAEAEAARKKPALAIEDNSSAAAAASSSSAAQAEESSSLIVARGKKNAPVDADEDGGSVAGSASAAPDAPVNYHVAALVAGNSKSDERFVPSALWQLSPTLIKLVVDNVEKNKRPALETMRRAHEQSMDRTALKPQPLSEKGQNFLHIECQRFVLACLHEHGKAPAAVRDPTDVIEAVLGAPGDADADAAAAEWKKKLLGELLASPYVADVLVPLPITVESSNALMAVVQHMRTAPESIRIAPASPAPMPSFATASHGGGTKQPAADCVVQ